MELRQKIINTIIISGFMLLIIAFFILLYTACATPNVTPTLSEEYYQNELPTIQEENNIRENDQYWELENNDPTDIIEFSKQNDI